MADYFVSSVDGSDADNGTTWALAKATLAGAIAIPALATDTIYIAHDHAENAAAWALVFPSTIGLRVISATAGSSPVTLQTGASVGGGAAATACSIVGNAYVYGVKFLGGTANNANSDLSIASTASGPHNLVFESCEIHCRGTNATANLSFGPGNINNNDEAYVKLINTSVGVGHISATILCGNVKVEGVGVTLMGTTGLTNLFTTIAGSSHAMRFTGCDLTAATYINIVSAVASTIASTFTFSQCMFDPYTTALTAATAVMGSAEVLLHDCSTADTHGHFEYHNGLGSVVSDTGIKLTAGAAGQSWKVTANSSASHAVPFCTPWFGYYNSTLGAAITPYIEVARDVSATAYQHNETWMELLCKSTSTSPASTLSTGRMPLLGTPANIDTGIGTGSWSPGSGSPDWSGKLVLGAPAAAATVTPAENGHIMARVCMAVADTVYVDPQIRT